MSRIVVLGGHGKVALLLAPLLVQAGHEVTSVVRNLDHEREVAATGATPVVADLEQLDVPGIMEIITGHDAVVWSAGAGGGNPSRTYAVDRDAAIRSMQAAMEAGVPRYVMVSYLGAGKDHGVAQDDPFHAYAEAKAAADDHLRGTDLEWTILGPTTLTLGPATGRIEVGDHPASGEVSRADVAQAVVDTLADRGTIHRRIGFASGETPIAQALQAV
ncbi:NAD(P)-dependent oxidoreductase [Arsenicicoccus sp. oral taxon 190]|uniref:NAD(P)-dependent oxidoreductase n=1 Tax=Arsenicicoccus sp. oral taxon 190 TaxID=1658671 RepID=UPI000679FD2E|nr:NAD(P)H-binding protein [Arsenicicoccus sp. oral taxon 190]AKT50478.1 NAD-dependent dehydratase [Arsenicicoccus sp. oral taxon 190]